MAVTARRTRDKDAADEGGNGKKKFSGEVFIVRERCKGCGFCVEFCPTKVLALDDSFNKKGYHPPQVVNLDACNGCDLCGLYCPDFAIHGVRHKNKEVD